MALACGQFPELSSTIEEKDIESFLRAAVGDKCYTTSNIKSITPTIGRDNQGDIVYILDFLTRKNSIFASHLGQNMHRAILHLLKYTQKRDNLLLILQNWEKDNIFSSELLRPLIKVIQNQINSLLDLEGISFSTTESSTAPGFDNDSAYEFYSNHHLPMSWFSDLFQLLKKPRSVYKINKDLSSTSIYDCIFYIYCSTCAEYQEFNANCVNRICAGCTKTLRIRETNFFVYIPLQQQIENSFRIYFDEILAYEKKMRSPKTCMTDVHNGIVFQNIQKEYAASEIIPLSLALNSDGAAIFKNNVNSLWPVQLIQNYSPPNVRYLLQNVLVVGLYYGQSKDVDFLQLLRPLCAELYNLRNGFDLTYLNQTFKLLPVVTQCIADLPAKVKLQNMISYNGVNACGFCLHPGKPVKNPGGSTTIRYLWQEPSPQLRDEDNTFKLMISGDQNVQNGIKGVSALLGLQHFNIIKSFGIDYLHAVLKGVLEKVEDLWFNSKNHQQDFYVSRKHQHTLDQRILRIKPTSEITRRPQSIAHAKKANELRTLLLYYLPIVIRGLQKKIYIDHFKLLSNSIYILLKSEITTEEIETAENKLLKFVKGFEELYGAQNVTFNLHLLTHIADSVRYLGPLWAQSTFTFEGNNGVLVKSVRGTTSVLRQITKRYNFAWSLRNQNKLDKENAGSIQILGCNSSLRLNKSEINILRKIVDENSMKTLKIYHRIQIGNTIYTSMNYKKTNYEDYFIQFNDLTIGKARFYVHREQCAFVLFEEYKIIHYDGQFININSSEKLNLKNVSEIKQKCMHIPMGLLDYVTFVPNFFEKT